MWNTELFGAQMDDVFLTRYIFHNTEKFLIMVVYFVILHVQNVPLRDSKR